MTDAGESNKMTPDELAEFRRKNLEPTMWKKGGPSPNPAGRPKGRTIANEIRKIIDESKSDIPAALAQVAIKRAAKGDYRFWKAVFEVIDGPTGGKVNISGNMIQIVFEDLKPPEGYTIPEMPSDELEVVPSLQS